MIAIRNLNLGQIVTSKNIIIDIGNEGCWIKFCEQMKFYVEHYKALLGKSVRLVTPKVTQGHVQTVVDCIVELLKLIDVEAIFINDYGVLYSFNKTGIKLNLIYGRLLVFCQEYELGYKTRYCDEEDINVIKSWSCPSYVYSNKIELLREMQFTGVELCPSDSVKDLLHYDKAPDFSIHMHYDSCIGACGRSCTTARNEKKPIFQCTELCNSVHSIKLDSMYGQNLKMDKQDIEHFENNILVGNMLYFITKPYNFPYELCADTIYDNRFDKIEEFLCK
ncbi:MAG: hypothetical protein HDQ99_03795 [Lachnospiraceae bacterium]|nr:hypothetical protein [Lachnospiraceae bacterium]